MSRLSLSKYEKLKSEKLIASLFKTGKSTKSYPLRAIFLTQEPYKDLKSPILFGVTVPKKLFKRAVDRNRIKRLIREAYRLHAGDLKEHFDGQGKQLVIMVLYQDKEIPEFQHIEKKMIVLLEKIKNTP